jgi:hypothetical protein
LSRNQSGPAAAKGVENQITFPAESADRLFAQGRREHRRVHDAFLDVADQRKGVTTEYGIGGSTLGEVDFQTRYFHSSLVRRNAL